MPFWALTTHTHKHTHECIYFVKCSFIKFVHTQSNHYFVDGFSQHVWVCAVLCAFHISALQRFNFSHTFHVVQCVYGGMAGIGEFRFCCIHPIACVSSTTQLLQWQSFSVHTVSPTHIHTPTYMHAGTLQYAVCHIYRKSTHSMNTT